MRLALLALWALLAGSALAVEWGFGDHFAPIELRPGERLHLDSARCGDCHGEIYADWSRSRHAAAWTNDVFQAGYILEPQGFCVDCHAPLAEQVAEIRANHAWYRAMHPRSDAPVPEKRPEPLASEGISCAVCHWRGGQILGPDGDAGAHATAAAPELRDPAFCAGCHEFGMAAGIGEDVAFTDVLMQSTYSEWRESGAAQTCQDCHMPGGRHLFHGANDRELLRGSVAVDARREGRAVRLSARSVGVGHHLPTGDLFRHLTLEVDDGSGFWVVETIGRAFQVVADPRTGELRKELAADTALRPGQPREVVVPSPGPLRWRLRYHYGSAADEASGLLPEDALVTTLAEGEVR